MAMGSWSDDAAWRTLLETLVGWDSVTGSDGERKFPERLAQRLGTLPYVKRHPDAVALHPTGDGRYILTALVRPQVRRPDTVVLLSHHDVVGVEDYGAWAPWAFSPSALTARLRQDPSLLDEAARRDLERSDMLFGRGVMDMKGGLAVELALWAEAAETGDWPGNLLLLSVPDEEVHSLGMRRALDVLKNLQEAEGLTYRLVLNAEPIFPRYPGDRARYLYTGSIGKLLAGFFCVGQVTHVGESLAGLNANVMAAALTDALEWAEPLVQNADGERTPPPTNLLLKGLWERYSVQIPFRAVTLSNILLLDHPLEAVLQRLTDLAATALAALYDRYRAALTSAGADPDHPPVPPVRIVRYHDLYQEAVRRVGAETAAELARQALTGKPGDARDQAIGLVDTWASVCLDWAPMAVLFVAPPFYPAVNSARHPLVRRVVDAVNTYLGTRGEPPLVSQAYYGGLSDLSFVGYGEAAAARNILQDTMPGFGALYDLPQALEDFAAVPGLNLGPVGFDAHRPSERIDADYAVNVLLPMLRVAVREALVEP